MARDDIELWRDPAPTRACAFCRQAVGTDACASCPRCATVYHPDCWASNSSRCAVYGCEPVSKPAPVPAPARRIFHPVQPETGPRWSGTGMVVVVVILINVARIGLQAGSRSDASRIMEIPPTPSFFPVVERSPDLSLAEFTRRIEQNPNDPQGYLSRGAAQQSRGFHDAAVKDFGRAIHLNPGFALAYHLRGHARADLGDLTEAIRDFTEAYALDTQDPEPLYDRACARYDLKQWKESLADFALSAEKGPATRDYARIRMSLIRRRLGEPDDLAAYLERRPSRNEPDDAWVVHLLRFVSGRTGEVDFLEHAYLDEKSMRSRLCQAWYYAGTLRLLAGNRPGATLYFQKCVDTDVRDYREYASAVVELEALRQR